MWSVVIEWAYFMPHLHICSDWLITKKSNIQSSVWATLMKPGMWVVMGTTTTHVVCCHEMSIFNTSFAYLFWLAVNKNWRCSGRSTQVPFWRKWVIDGFEVVIGQKIFWQNFWRFGPFPVGFRQRSSRGQIFKMLQMTFHVYQITREVVRITKIYSLLWVGCMVRETLTTGHPKVKWGQIFNNIQFAWMTYQIIPLGLHIPKIYTFQLFQLPLLKQAHLFEFRPWCSGRSTQVQNGDYWLQEIDNPHNSVNHLNWFCLAYDYSHQKWIWYYFVFSSNEISKTLNAYILKLVLWHLITSSTTVFN